MTVHYTVESRQTTPRRDGKRTFGACAHVNSQKRKARGRVLLTDSQFACRLTATPGTQPHTGRQGHNEATMRRP